MSATYSADVCHRIISEFHTLQLHRPIYLEHYEAGTILEYTATSLQDATKSQMRLQVEKFVGGGFAGQVYQVTVLSCAPLIPGIRVGEHFAVKILIPPSRLAKLFRDTLYAIGFQGSFALQSNPYAARSGALWQKFIRRAAKIRWQDERCVVDIYATFCDEILGSCGEISEWVDGRTWKLEVNDHLNLLRTWQKNPQMISSAAPIGSPEYRAKRIFMKEFVELLHDVGAHEFARQYEWSTCKSQPNILKRREFDDSPDKGLVAVDFRAGLTLLPFLPMSPGDIKLIWQGICRGSLVQFDRGDLTTLEKFIAQCPNEFADMSGMLEELRLCEKIYRTSAPDITHHHLKLLYSSELWHTMSQSNITGWRVRNWIDSAYEQKLRKTRLGTYFFLLLGIFPIVGTCIRKLLGHGQWRKHYHSICTSWDYFCRAWKGHIIEKVLSWYRHGRIQENSAYAIIQSPIRYVYHRPLSFLPGFLHRILTDVAYCISILYKIIIHPVKLYFSAQYREQWLYNMIEEGTRKHILTPEDAKIISSQVQEPFIQKYLQCLAVHVCTLPVTQIVSVTLAILYSAMHPELTPAERTMAITAILVFFQIIPISPGSLVRGLYVVYLVIRERNFKDYNIAVFLGFFKYIGYLAFPIQMTYRYPELARFMAGHWATEAVHIVPVFGEHGALLEHSVFDWFYNWPISIRRQIRQRIESRKQLPTRYVPTIVCSILFASIIVGLQMLCTPYVSNMTYFYLCIYPLFSILLGYCITISVGGMALSKRVVLSTISGLILALAYTVGMVLCMQYPHETTAGDIVIWFSWRMFFFGLFTPIGLILAEFNLPEPEKY